MKSPIEAVEWATQVKILKTFLAEQTIGKDSKSNSSISTFFIGFVDFQTLFKLNTILDDWSRLKLMYFFVSTSLIFNLNDIKFVELKIKIKSNLVLNYSKKINPTTKIKFIECTVSSYTNQSWLFFKNLFPSLLPFTDFTWSTVYF